MLFGALCALLSRSLCTGEMGRADASAPAIFATRGMNAILKINQKKMYL